MSLKCVGSLSWLQKFLIKGGETMRVKVQSV